MERRIGLLFDSLRAPYDVAHIYQVATALGNCDLYLSGNSINPHHKKIVNKIKSWGIENLPEFRKFDSLELAVNQLHSEGKYMIGTSPKTDKNLYTFDFTKNGSVIVFGTESSGLTESKLKMLDNIIKIPMNPECNFLTLPTAVPIIAYEFHRQLRRKNEVIK